MGVGNDFLAKSAYEAFRPRPADIGRGGLTAGAELDCGDSRYSIHLGKDSVPILCPS
jgi:hypothetical protein